MSALQKYRQLMVKLFTSRRQSNVPLNDDAILEEMDLVWHRMSGEERNIAEELSRRVAAGDVSEEQFIVMYDEEGKDAMSHEQQPTPEPRVQVTPSAFLQTHTTTVAGTAAAETTKYIGFIAPMKHFDIQRSHTPA